jgi:metal-responsive CopG/Arc/MetJ family transcriptional regulator
MATAKVKLDKDLLARAKKVAETAGYSSVEEFLTHLIEKELANVEDAQDEEALKERLRGLGYIS